MCPVTPWDPGELTVVPDTAQESAFLQKLYSSLLPQDSEEYQSQVPGRLDFSIRQRHIDDWEGTALPVLEGWVEVGCDRPRAPGNKNRDSAT